MTEGGTLAALTASHKKITVQKAGKVGIVSLRVAGVDPGSVICSASLMKPDDVLHTARKSQTCGGAFDFAEWDFQGAPVKKGWKINISMWCATAGTWRSMAEVESDY